MANSIPLTLDLIDYIKRKNPKEDDILIECRLETMEKYPDKAWYIIPHEQAIFIQFIIRIIKPRNAIEIGVFTGYSSLVTALTMKDIWGDECRFIGCDISKEWTDYAIKLWKKAGVSEITEIYLQPATETLDILASQGILFDYAFIDADKQNTLNYYNKIINILNHNGVIVIDNVLWDGKVAVESIDDPDTKALREIAEYVKLDKRVFFSFCGIGDGLLLIIKK